MPTTVYRSCPLREVARGVAIEIAGDRVVSARRDHAGSFREGYICSHAGTRARTGQPVEVAEA